MTQRFAARVTALVATGLLVSCASDESQLKQHADKVRSLRGTTVAVAQAWLNGDASGTYARTALEQTFQLLEQEHTAVADTPEDLAKPQANSIARDTEQLARLISALERDVTSQDAPNARRHLADLGATTSEHP